MSSGVVFGPDSAPRRVAERQHRIASLETPKALARSLLHRVRMNPTRREREVLGLIACGYSNKEISLALGCALKTVETHITSLLRKYDVDSRLRLALRCSDPSLARR